MDTITAIETRRSVKHYDNQYQISDTELAQLIALAQLSPTAFNIQHWRFLVVKEPQLRAEIRAASWMQAQITDASLLIVLCADLQAWQKQPHRYWRDAPAEVAEGVLAAIDEYYDSHPQRQRDEAMRSCGIAAQTLMLAATAMGYDSCPMDLADFDAVARLVNLPDDHLIAMYIVIGKGSKQAWPRAGQLPQSHVMFIDRFPAPVVSAMTAASTPLSVE